MRVCSHLSHGGVLDVVPAISELDDGVAPHVELGQVSNLVVEVGAGLGIGVKVSGAAEEVVAQTLVRVVQDAVLVGVVEGGSILHDQLHLPDQVTLVSSGRASLPGLLVPRAGGVIAVSGVHSHDEERGAEGA